METRLKKWRSGMEAVISNLKRGYQLRRCEWKGWEHFKANVFWSVIAYNIGVISVYFIKRILKEEIEEVNVRAKSSYSMAV
jgi:IS5 family transposase